jgi:hypothetical protein
MLPGAGAASSISILPWYHLYGPLFTSQLSLATYSPTYLLAYNIAGRSCVWLLVMGLGLCHYMQSHPHASVGSKAGKAQHSPWYTVYLPDLYYLLVYI